MKNRALILFAHGDPDRSRVNRRLLDEAHSLAEVTVHDLAGRYCDYRLDKEYEQSLLARHELIIMHFPVYWYSMPALLKAWFDQVLCADLVAKRKQGVLRGKRLWTVATAGGLISSSPFSVDPDTESGLFFPYRRTAEYFEMTFLAPLLVQQVSRSSTLDHIADIYRARLREYLAPAFGTEVTSA